MVVEIKREIRPSGRTVVTLAGTDDHMPQIVVPSGALGHPGLPAVLELVADLKRTVLTKVSRSAKQRPQGE